MYMLNRPRPCTVNRSAPADCGYLGRRELPHRHRDAKRSTRRAMRSDWSFVRSQVGASFQVGAFQSNSWESLLAEHAAYDLEINLKVFKGRFIWERTEASDPQLLKTESRDVGVIVTVVGTDKDGRTDRHKLITDLRPGTGKPEPGTSVTGALTVVLSGHILMEYCASYRMDEKLEFTLDCGKSVRSFAAEALAASSVFNSQIRSGSPGRSSVDWRLE
ncbi:hypothetical protein B0H17DRAFT_1139309 [Mycena rosella]|uniref:Uncharacterized protein n=1 Tax=Mycena rosella TaxID=1033263 RepID=A0AAD7D4F5_MYCRO|nr:hypothetical protein B0H17DRAFT_1139309 [Mycena rosella]